MNLVAMFMSVFLTAVSAGNMVSGDVSPGDVVQDPVSNEMAATLNSIDEKLDTVVLALDNSVDAYQVSDYYKQYFAGVLQNMGHTEYLCYAQRFQNSGSSYNYTTHYYLLYDLQLQDGQIVAGSYPCLDVYAVDNVYYMDQITKTFDGYPTMGYASFEPYSALIDESFPVMEMCVLVVGVAVIFTICRKTVFS